MRKMGIRAKIVLPVTAAVLVCMALVAGTLQISSTRLMTTAVEDQAVTLATQYKYLFEKQIDRPMGELQTTAEAIRQIIARDEADRVLLINLIKSQADGNDAFISGWAAFEPNKYDYQDIRHRNRSGLGSDANGRFTPVVKRNGDEWSVEPLDRIDENPNYAQVKKTHLPHITNPTHVMDAGNATTGGVFSLIVPIQFDKRFFGAIGIDLSTVNFEQALKEIHPYGEGHLRLMAADGKYIVHESSEEVGSNSPLTEEVDRSLSGETVTAKHENSYHVFVPIDLPDLPDHWVLEVTIPMSAALAGVQRMGSVTMITIVGSLLIILLVLYYLSSSISKTVVEPVGMLAKTAARLAEGDLDIQLESRSNDEVGRLTAAFATTIDNLRAQAQEVRRVSTGDLTVDVPVRSDRDVMGLSIQRMVQTNHNLLFDVKETAAGVAAGAAEISSGSQNMAQGATEQAGAIEQLSASIREIYAQTQSNAAAAHTASELAVQIRQSARHGNERVQRLVKAVQDIDQASGDIKKIIRTIDEIAFQTNILALNAAIEAASAGQAGKGFAVVADEVKRLAGRSAEAAQQTGELIEGSIRLAREGVAFAADADHALSGIDGDIAKAVEWMGSIATASNEQVAAIEQVNRGVEQVSIVVQKNSATAEQMAASSQEMSAQAEGLRLLMGRFTLRKQKVDVQADIAMEQLKVQESHEMIEGAGDAEDTALMGDEWEMEDLSDGDIETLDDAGLSGTLSGTYGKY